MAKSQAPDAKSSRALARELRRYCDGKFGNMTANRWNDRIIGTSGAYRQSTRKDTYAEELDQKALVGE